MMEKLYKTPDLESKYNSILDEIRNRIEIISEISIPQRIIVGINIRNSILEYLEMDEGDGQIFIFGLPVEFHFLKDNNCIAVEVF